MGIAPNSKIVDRSALRAVVSWSWWSASSFPATGVLLGASCGRLRWLRLAPAFAAADRSAPPARSRRATTRAPARHHELPRPRAGHLAIGQARSLPGGGSPHQCAPAVVAGESPYARSSGEWYGLRTCVIRWQMGYGLP